MRDRGINSVLNVKAVVAAFNQEKALVGAFSVITNLRMELFGALVGDPRHSVVISNTLGSDENYHELMDVVGSLINPEIHEKCMHSTGDVIIWLGEWIQSMLSKLSSMFSCGQATRMKRWRTCGPLPSLRMIQSPLKV